MKLILTIAWTHITRRARQTLVAVLGVVTGVGFSIMMAAMMEGSQDDFIATLVDALPHISVTDELREPTPQPANVAFPAAEIHGLTPEVRRPGIKNPMATIASLQSWVPGALTASVQSKAVLRFAGRDLTISVVGIDPHTEGNVSNLTRHMREGTLNSLYRASNAILLGDRLARKIGARVNSNLTLVSARGVTLTATVVGTFHSGFRMTDETTGYVLLRTAQTLEKQIGVINEIRVRTADPLGARLISERIGQQTGYKSISWQEAQEDLLSAITLRNVLMYTIVGAILLVASFGTFNIVATITHEKTRDIAIMKSMGFAERDIKRIVLNMERWRWMPEDLGPVYVWNNSPEFMLYVFKDRKPIYADKILVGTPIYATPVFDDEMETIVFNPDWIAPETVVKENLLPHLREGNFSILKVHKLQVSYNGTPVNASKINWGRVNVLNYTFLQKGGPGNNLGKVKFLFPNKHDVYMHDTTQKTLFAKTVRAESHGCMRVQNPDQFAAVILKRDQNWSAGQVESAFLNSQDRQVPLRESIPVYINYFTLWANDDGSLSTFADIYGHDARMAAALFGEPMPFDALPYEEASSFPVGSEPVAQQRRTRRVPVGRNHSIADSLSNFLNN